MRNKVILIIMLLMLAVMSCNLITSEKTDHDSVSNNSGISETIDRGRYLVTIGGCHDCHSPKTIGTNGLKEDSTRLLSGYDSSRPFVGFDKNVARSGNMVIFNIESTAFAGPWGVSYAANLTPHKSGIGGWDLKRFAKAMKEGKWRGLNTTRPLLPPMPWQNYRQIADEDLEAIFTYLQSLTPVDNPVPVPLFDNPQE